MNWKTSALLVLSMIIGCGGSNEIPANVAIKSRSAFEESIELVKQRDYEASIPLLTESLKSGVLTNTEVVQAYLLRAKCYLFTEQLPSALADIEFAERGIEETEQVVEAHLVKSLYFKKSADLSKSEIELQNAQAIDPNAKPITQ